MLFDIANILVGIEVRFLIKHVGINFCLLRAIENKEGETFLNVKGRERNLLMREIKFLLRERGRERKNFNLIETILP